MLALVIFIVFVIAVIIWKADQNSYKDGDFSYNPNKIKLSLTEYETHLVNLVHRAKLTPLANNVVIESRKNGPLNIEAVRHRDGRVISGTVYVLETKSTAAVFQSYKPNLYKIGFTKGTVKKRISGAVRQKTFLEAPVDVVMQVKCFNDINAQRLESLIHGVLKERKLNVLLDCGYRPNEWFHVPLEKIESTIGDILSEYYIDATTNKLVYSLTVNSALEKVKKIAEEEEAQRKAKEEADRLALERARQRALEEAQRKAKWKKRKRILMKSGWWIVAGIVFVFYGSVYLMSPSAEERGKGLHEPTRLTATSVSAAPKAPSSPIIIKSITTSVKNKEPVTDIYLTNHRDDVTYDELKQFLKGSLVNTPNCESKPVPHYVFHFLKGGDRMYIKVPMKHLCNQ